MSTKKLTPGDITKKDCEQWIKKPTVNPKTKSAIKEGKGYYLTYEKTCDGKFGIKLPKKSKIIEESQEESPKKIKPTKKTSKKKEETPKKKTVESPIKKTPTKKTSKKKTVDESPKEEIPKKLKPTKKKESPIKKTKTPSPPQPESPREIKKTKTPSPPKPESPIKKSVKPKIIGKPKTPVKKSESPREIKKTRTPIKKPLSEYKLEDLRNIARENKLRFTGYSKGDLYKFLDLKGLLGVSIDDVKEKISKTSDIIKSQIDEAEHKGRSKILIDAESETVGSILSGKGCKTDENVLKEMLTFMRVPFGKTTTRTELCDLVLRNNVKYQSKAAKYHALDICKDDDQSLPCITTRREYWVNYFLSVSHRYDIPKNVLNDFLRLSKIPSVNLDEFISMFKAYFPALEGAESDEQKREYLEFFIHKVFNEMVKYPTKKISSEKSYAYDSMKNKLRRTKSKTDFGLSLLQEI